jgi:hypothetical protein
VVAKMNRRQHLRREHRRAHHAKRPFADRPRLVLDRASYPNVKSAHIVPRMYQRAFAVDDMVAVHVDGRAECVAMPTRNAGTRSRYYRRKRPDGQPINDIEASLAFVEHMASGPLAQLIAGESMTVERKGAVAQLLGVQMLRGPAFFEQREDLLRPLLQGLEEKDFRPGGLALVCGDLELARSRVLDLYLGPTQRFMTMLTSSVKLATLLAHMRWQILRFEGCLLAYSDHPVVVWPMDVAKSAPFDRQGLGPLTALEIRVSISPSAAILMTWVDRSDDIHVSLGAEAAAELNAFTVAQADRQWMHSLFNEPEVPTGVFEPISRLVEPRYDRAAMSRSARRATAQQFVERVKNRRHIHDVEVLIDVERSRLKEAS